MYHIIKLSMNVTNNNTRFLYFQHIWFTTYSIIEGFEKNLRKI